MRLITLFLTMLALAGTAAADQPARLQLGSSALVTTGRGWGGPPPLELRLTLDKAVPFRAFLVDDPARLIVDLRDTDLAGLDPTALFGADRVTAIRWGSYREGWSRVVVELPGTYRIEQAYERTKALQPQIVISLRAVSAQDFAPRPSATAALRDLPEPVPQQDAAPRDRITVVIDPGHGGIDPGAQADGRTEADLVLGFGQELQQVLTDRGFNVVMTRDDDSFVRLDQRMTIAREAKADLFISLHADALPTGQAAGATVYVWNPQSNAQANAQLIQRHQPNDLLGDTDMTGAEDQLASVLMDFARTDTQPRSENLARWLASRMGLMGIGLHQRPVQGANFSVLRSADIPSVLLELGFLSDDRDRANLTDPLWRAGMVGVIADAAVGWARDEQSRAALLRR